MHKDIFKMNIRIRKNNDHVYLCIFHILLYQCRIKNDWEMIVRQEMPSRLTLAVFLEGNLCWCRCQDVSKVGNILFLLFLLFTRYHGGWSCQSQPESLRTRISGHPKLFHTRRRSFQHVNISSPQKKRLKCVSYTCFSMMFTVSRPAFKASFRNSWQTKKIDQAGSFNVLRYCLDADLYQVTCHRMDNKQLLWILLHFLNPIENK